MPSDITIAKKYVAHHMSAGHRNILHTLNFQEFSDLYNQTVCAYTGETLTKSGPRQGTFERKDAFLGYVHGNVVVVTHYANEAKSSLDKFMKSNLPDDVKRKLLFQQIGYLTKRMNAKARKSAEEPAPQPIEDDVAPIEPPSSVPSNPITQLREYLANGRANSEA